MTAQWTAQDRERKKRVIRNLSRSYVAMIRANNPKTGKPCTRIEALQVLREMHEHVVAKYAQKHGFALAGQYRGLIDEVMEELAAKAADD